MGNQAFKFLIRRISWLLLCAVVIAGCQFPAMIPATPEVQARKVAQVAGKPVVDYVTAHSISELTQKSALIVLGQIEKVDRAVNMVRDVNDIGKPDLHFLKVGQVYQVKLERVLKGAAPGPTLLIIQPEGFLEKPQTSEIPSPQDVKAAQQNSDHILFAANHRYLLFLWPFPTKLQGQQYYVGGIHPWRFNVTDPNKVYAESPADIVFPETSLAKIVEEIKTLATPVAAPPLISPLPTP